MAKSELQLYNEFIEKEARRMMSGNPLLDPNPKVNLEIHKQFAKGEYPIGGSEGKPWLKGKRMAQKLLKGGGGIKLPQLRGGLPMMLLSLLAGGLGMGMRSDGNEEIDALLG